MPLALLWGLPLLSPSIGMAMMLRVLLLWPLLFVTHTSTRFRVTPVNGVGRRDIQPS